MWNEALERARQWATSANPEVSNRQGVDLSDSSVMAINGLIDAWPAPGDVDPNIYSGARSLVKAIYAEAQGKFSPKVQDVPAGQALMGAPPETQAAAITIATCVGLELACELRRIGWHQNCHLQAHLASHSLEATAKSLGSRRLPYSAGMLSQMVQSILKFEPDDVYLTPMSATVTKFENLAKSGPLSEALRLKLRELSQKLVREMSPIESQRVARRIAALVDDDAERNVVIPSSDAWSAALKSQIDGAPVEQATSWRALVAHCQATTSAKPSTRWLKQAASLVASLPRESVVAGLLAALGGIGKPGTKHAADNGIDDATLIDPAQSDLLRGLVWLASLVDDPRLLVALADAAEKAYQKVAGHGPRNAKVGNACVWSLSHVGSLDAAAQLSRLKSRVKHPSCRGQVIKALHRAAESAGVTLDVLEELAVPSFGMSEPGILRQSFGDAAGELRIVLGNRTELRWFKSANAAKSQATPPAEIKEAHAAEIKDFKATTKAIEKLLPSLRNRIDNLLRHERTWPVRAWRERYLDHPLVGTLARRLIWRVAGGGQSQLVAWNDGRLVEVHGRPLEQMPDDAAISLWHPIDSSAEEVRAWRDWLDRHQVVQPFKQAHREIYLLTDAERTTDTYSNRFAAHVLKQHQLSALCQQRGWKYALMGAWDCDSRPTFVDAALGWGVEYWVEPVGEYPNDTSAAGIFLYVATDQVRFFRLQLESALEGLVVNDIRNELAPLATVPPRVFSELMRDVDLFVGVCSVGNDPQWTDGGHYGAYWQSYSFGDLAAAAQTRRDVLQRLLPRLKIADRCSLDDRFLTVRGDLRSYKIHLGSGNILMTPNDQYLCIVPLRGGEAKGTDRVFLPFEGDQMLSVILSKALLLADDRKITDPTIVRQIAS
jgi:hypothetical protein